MAQGTINTPRETTIQRIATALENILNKIVDTSRASNIDYDNTESGLSATKAQGAIDELASEKADKSTTLAGYGITNAYTKAEVNDALNNNIETIAEAIKQWDIGSYTIDLYGIGSPETYYTASSTYSGDKYLDVATGKMYDCLQTGADTYTWRQAPVVLQLKSDINASAIEDIQEDISTSLTATGNPLTIEASESNLVECVVTISSSTNTVTITVKDKSTNPTVTNTYTIDLGRTVSSGTLDVVKGTLTTGGTTYNLPPTQIKLLKGNNVISSNVSSLSIKYYPDNVLGQLKGDIEGEYDARLERLEQYTDVFGFIEDMDVLSPTERIKYIGKNENYEPLTVDLNTGSYTLGDWGDFPFLVDNKPYMVKPDGTPDYQLNEYDYTKKLDGTDSDVANEDYDGGAFSWGRKIYKKQWMVGNKRYVLFSFDKKDGFHADGFINKDGKELDGRWIPMFYGTVVDGKAKSIATGNCISGGNITTDAQHNAIIAFDSNANFFGGAFVETLIDLLMMFAKNSDLQAAYGYGNSSGYVNDSSKNYGMLNNAVVNGGQFYGRSGGKTLNKALHSIVLATYNSYMRDPYEVIKNGKVVVSEDYTYDPTGATYTDTGITVPNQSANAWRYPKKYIAVPRYGSIPDISVGGASTSLGRADGTYTLSNQSGVVIVCLRFCLCNNGAVAGLSCRAWDCTASDTWWDFGFALLLDGSAVA